MPDADDSMAAIEVKILLPLVVPNVATFYFDNVYVEKGYLTDLECRSFQKQSFFLVKTEHQVHVLYGLANGAFQKVVYDGSDDGFVAELVYVDECLVGVDHLF